MFYKRNKSEIMQHQKNDIELRTIIIDNNKNINYSVTTARNNSNKLRINLLKDRLFQKVQDSNRDRESQDSNTINNNFDDKKQ